MARWGAAVPLGQLRAWHVGALAAVLVAGVVAARRGWRRGVALAGVAAAAVALAPAVAVLRPSAVDGRSLVAGARLWRDGRATVLVVDDLRASPEALLSSLHVHDVRRLTVLIVTRPGRAAASDVSALLRRFPPQLVLGPAGHGLPGEVAVPPPGSQVSAGRLVVTFGAEGRRLGVAVSR